MYSEVAFILLFMPSSFYAEKEKTSTSTGRDVGADLEKDPWNARLLASVPRPYEVVYPLQRDGRRYSAVSTWHMQGRDVIHVPEAVFSFDVFGQKQEIHVELNRHLLSPEIRRTYDAEDGRPVISERVDHCYYQGSVRGHAGSRVALSSCDGLSGLLEFGNATFLLRPLRGSNLGINHPHVLYPAITDQNKLCGLADDRWPSFRDLHREEYTRRLKYANVTARRKRNVGRGRRLRMAILIDHHVFAMKNSSQDLSVLDEVLLVVNIADMYYRSVGVNLTVVEVESWNRRDKLDVRQDLRSVLRDLLTYRHRAGRGRPHDNLQFFSGLPTLARHAGLAVPDSICTDRSIAVNKMKSLFEPLSQAEVLVHMLAHNLGLAHDTDGCACSMGDKCVMNQIIVERGDQHVRGFSACSERDLDHLLAVGLADCLLPGNQVSYRSVCGNGLVERGEQCDCASLEECLRTDPCCDPRTCLLHPWAQCNSGPCCNNCTFEVKKMCRPSGSECDVPEFCPGTGGSCPEDEWARDGSACALGRGYCHRGACYTHTSQCRDIWGKAATMADRACYNRFNVLGTTNGHCGANATSHLYNKCEKRHVFCGLLHCAGGEAAPLLGAEQTYTKVQVNEANHQYQCNLLNPTSIPGFPQLGLVRDGTKCGEGAVCLAHACVPLSALRQGACPSNDPAHVCSGHGICTNKLRCYCAPFWTGADCADMMAIPTRESEPVVYRPIITYTDDKNRTHTLGTPTRDQASQSAESESISTKTLMIILGAVAGVVMVFLVLLMLCYRRQSPAGYHSPYAPPWRKKKPGAPRSLSSDEGATTPRIIKFGSMPSYREEKYRELRDRVLRIKQGLLDPAVEAATDDELAQQEKRASRLSHDSQLLAQKPKRGILKNGERRGDDERHSDYDNVEAAERVARIQSLDDLIRRIEQHVLTPESGAGEARCELQLDAASPSDGPARRPGSPHFPEYPALTGKLSVFVPAEPAEPCADGVGDAPVHKVDAQTGLNKDLKVSPLTPPHVEKRPKRKNKKRVTSSGSESSLKSASSQGSQSKGKRKPKSSQTDADVLTVELPVLKEVNHPEIEMKTFADSEVMSDLRSKRDSGTESDNIPLGASKTRALEFKPNILPLSPNKESKSPLYQNKFAPPGSGVLAPPPVGFQRAPTESPLRGPTESSVWTPDSPVRVNLAEEEDLDLNDLSPESNVLGSFSSDTSPNDPSKYPPFRHSQPPV